MEEFDLGPNGGLVYCMEYLLANFSWLEDKLKQLGSQYVLFDCPGQVSNTQPFQHEHHLSNLNSKLFKKNTTFAIFTLPVHYERYLYQDHYLSKLKCSFSMTS